MSICPRLAPKVPDRPETVVVVSVGVQEANQVVESQVEVVVISMKEFDAGDPQEGEPRCHVVAQRFGSEPLLHHLPASTSVLCTGAGQDATMQAP